MRVSVSYFDQILGKRESWTHQLCNFTVFNVIILWFWNFAWVQNFAKIAKFNAFKVYERSSLRCILFQVVWWSHVYSNRMEVLKLILFVSLVSICRTEFVLFSESSKRTSCITADCIWSNECKWFGCP